MWFLCVVVLVALATAAASSWMAVERRRRRSSGSGGGLPPLYSPIPLLGCSLEWKRDAKSMVTALSKTHDAVTINMSGMHIVLLLDARMAKDFWTSRQLNSAEALVEFGFADVLGPLNVLQGPAWHTILLRKGVGRDDFLASFRRSFSQSWASTRQEGRSGIEVYGFLRLAVLRAVCVSLLGQTVDAKFAEDFLGFQRKSERATALCTVFGPWVAWLPLYRARLQRLELQHQLRGRLTSPYMRSLSDLVGDETLLPELAMGILTAAPKNTAIVAASTIIDMLKEGSDDVETYLTRVLKETCLPLGGVRKVVGEHPWSIGSYSLPPGTIVSLSHLALQQESNADWNTSFGGGSHACPGKGLALSMIKFIIETMRPHLSKVVRISPLIHSRPSFADRDFAWVNFL